MTITEQLAEALKALHDDCAEYIKVNNLSGAFDNHVMRQARAALAAYEASKAPETFREAASGLLPYSLAAAKQMGAGSSATPSTDGDAGLRAACEPQCSHCGGSGVEEIYGGYGTVNEVPCSYCKVAPAQDQDIEGLVDEAAKAVHAEWGRMSDEGELPYLGSTYVSPSHPRLVRAALLAVLPKLRVLDDALVNMAAEVWRLTRERDELKRDVQVSRACLRNSTTVIENLHRTLAEVERERDEARRALEAVDAEIALEASVEGVVDRALAAAQEETG